MIKSVRRLQKIGSSTLVSLPKEWVDTNGLVKGSQVDVEAAGDTILISARQDATRPMTDLMISYPLPAEENIVANITGAYLLGYDVICIMSGGSSIPTEDREKIRNSMRRLVGMEIVEEDASHVTMQFLLDSSTLSPARILRRMSSIALGMLEEVSAGLVSGGDKANLKTIPMRDAEVNRQYFLLVRLIRSTLGDRRLAGAFNLKNIDILDYRVAANLLENAGDSIVELAGLVDADSTLSKARSSVLFSASQRIGRIAQRSIDAFTKPDRLLAIEAISLHKELEVVLGGLRETPGDDKIPVAFLDMIHMFERIARSWADVADLVKPIYK